MSAGWMGVQRWVFLLSSANARVLRLALHQSTAIYVSMQTRGRRSGPSGRNEAEQGGAKAWGGFERRQQSMGYYEMLDDPVSCVGR